MAKVGFTGHFRAPPPPQCQPRPGNFPALSWDNMDGACMAVCLGGSPCH